MARRNASGQLAEVASRTGLNESDGLLLQLTEGDGLLLQQGQRELGHAVWLLVVLALAEPDTEKEQRTHPKVKPKSVANSVQFALVPLRVCMLADHVAYVPVAGARLACGERLHEAVVGCLDERLAALVHFTHNKGLQGAGSVM